MPLYILTWKIKCTKIGNKIIEKIMTILLMKCLNLEVKKLLSILNKIIKVTNNIKIKIGNLNIKKLKNYDLGVSAVS